MVEGPGCKLKGIKIKAKLRGQTVHAVEGNAVQKVYLKSDTYCLHQHENIVFRP